MLDLMTIGFDPQPFELEDIMTSSRSGFASLLGLGLVLGTPGISRADAGIATTAEPRSSAWPEAAGVASDDAARSLTFETYRDQKEEHRWRLKATNGQLCEANPWPYPPGAKDAPGVEAPDTTINNEFNLQNQ